MKTESGIGLIATERQRQIEDEGYTSVHDDRHRNGEIVHAAAAYALEPYSFKAYDHWPWGANEWKPGNDPIETLVKAGALIAAEIDRLLREQAKG